MILVVIDQGLYKCCRVCQAMGLIVFNKLKLDNFFETCVERILRASITPFARFWIGPLRFHDICNRANTLRELKDYMFKANLTKFQYFYSRG